MFSRTQDLAAEFAHSLSDADEVLLMNIYPARELPIEGVSSELIRSKLKSSVQLICSPSEILQQIQIKSEGVILTIGAGDIDRLVQPIADILKSKNIS